MLSQNIKQFKGLAQHILYEELSPEYCHTMVNLDVDNPLGRLSKRGGYTKKYSDSLTDVISACEYKIPTTGDTILIFNDNGTLKTYTNGASLTSLSLPSGAALTSGFRNQYFGFKDHIIITTGNGSTNYVLGYHYIKRVNASNTGLFGNVEQFTGYKLLKNQIVFENGQFSLLYNVVQLGSYYYISFQGSRYVEKRNSSFQLVDRILAQADADAKTTIALAADDTYLYVGTEDGLYKINPNGWVTEDSSTDLTGILGVAVDDDYVFACAANDVTRYDITDLSSNSNENHIATFRDITCDPDSGGAIYLLTTGSSGTIERYVKGNWADGNETHSVSPSIGVIYNIIYDNTNDYVVATGSGGSTKRYTDSTLTLVDTNTVTGAQFRVLLPDSSPVEDRYGTVYPLASDTPTYPSLVSISVESIDSGGSLDAGTYFYKIAIVDVDGQEFLLSDPIIVQVPGSYNVDLEIVVNDTLPDILYRGQTINIYRAYNSTSQDELEEATNYKLLDSIDINSSQWIHEADLNIYHYHYTDDTTEANISDVTYQENSGFSENTKSRYVNYKVHEWIGNELHAANMYVDGKTYKNKIAVSQADGPDVVVFVNTYDFNPYDGDEIKNITTAYGRAYIMKNRRTGIFYQQIPERILNFGIADTDSYFNDNETIYMITNKGLAVVSGANGEIISDPVKTYFDAISDFTDSCVFLRDDLSRILFSFPGDHTFIFNKLHKLWMHYNGAYAFKGYFKNLDNEYIGFGQEPAEPLADYFFELDDATQDNGESITISYETPLLKMSELDGEDIELIKMNYRVDKTGTINFVLYDYAEASKRTVETISLEDPVSGALTDKTKFFQNAWGEAFSLAISGTSTKFKLSSISLIGESAGETANV